MPIELPTASPQAALVLLAAGSGVRVGGDVNKVFLPLAGRRVFTWSLRWATELPNVARVLLVVCERDVDLATAVLAREAPDIDVELVIGGDSRHGSEWEALQVLAQPIEAGELDVAVIHDAARPLAGTATFTEVVAVQTPQGFRAGDLLFAYRAADAEGFVGTDTASCVERLCDLTIRCIQGSASNMKITFPEDLCLAEHLLGQAHWGLSGSNAGAQ